MNAVEMLLAYLTSGGLGALDYELLKWVFAQWPKMDAWMNTPKRALAYATTALLVAAGYEMAVILRGLPVPVDWVARLTAWASFCVPAFLANQLIHSTAADRFAAQVQDKLGIPPGAVTAVLEAKLERVEAVEAAAVLDDKAKAVVVDAARLPPK